MFDNTSQNTKILLATSLVLSACVVDSVTIAYDGSVMGSVNVMPSYVKFFNITTTTKAVNSTATHIGAILMAPFAGLIVDKRGRREGILISAILNVLGAVISGAAQNIAMFIAGRTIIGIGVRAFALGMYYSCWALGSFLAAGISYGCAQLEPSNWSWRIPSLFQGFAPVLIIFMVPFLPESPRWLIYNDRLEDGLKVLARINGATVDDQGVQLQYQEIIDTLNFEKQVKDHAAFREIVRNAPNRKRLALALSIAPLTMLTGSNVITYYYGDMLQHAGITASKTKMAINLVLSAWQFVIAVSGSLVAEKLGRRLLCLSSLGSCTAMFYVVGALTSVYGDGHVTSGVYGTVASIFLYLGFYSFGLTPLTQMYPPEVLSYKIRATGMAMFTLLAKACGIFVTMVFPFMFKSLGWKTYMVNASWNAAFWIGVYFFWVETKGKTLEEIDVLFDGVKHSDVPDLNEVRDDEKATADKIESL